MKKNKNQISQNSLLLEYFKEHPNKSIPHPEIVDWSTKEFLKRTGRIFRDSDRGIRKLHQDGFLIKEKKGVYKYDPKMIKKEFCMIFQIKLSKKFLKEINLSV